MKSKIKLIISIILLVLYIISNIYLGISINNFGIIPNKYLIIMYIVMTIILLLIILLLTRKHLVFNIIAYILIILIGVGSVVLTNYINTTNNAFKKISSEKVTSVSYYVLVKENSKIDDVNDLEGTTIGYIKDSNTTKLLEMINKKINCSQKEYSDYTSIISEYMANKPIVINSGMVDALSDEISSFKDSYKVVYTFTLTDSNKESDSAYIDITSEPFILYISGIDTYGDISTRSRSDVNILVVVNPKTGKILLVNTPRDYYVQLHGTTGLKDKLTHSGIYGINMSIDTMQDLYNIKINKYLRVNFNSLIKVVDVIGGVDIDSDASFTPWTNKNVTVVEGINHFNGEQALAYARERHAYIAGDRHRGENQEQVITEIINKITSTNSLISNYDKIIDTISNSLETSLSNSEIKALAKMQLSKNTKWNIESISVDGTGAKSYTYSMGTNYLLYVMEPDQETLNTAKTKISSVLNNK